MSSLKHSFGDFLILSVSVCVCVFWCPSFWRRKLIRDKIDHLHAQLSITATTPPAGAKTAGGGKGSKRGVNATAGKEEEEEERAAATLRLLTSVAKFHRCAARDLVHGKIPQMFFCPRALLFSSDAADRRKQIFLRRAIDFQLVLLVTG